MFFNLDVGNPKPVPVEGPILAFHLFDDLLLPVRQRSLVLVLEPHHVPYLVGEVQLRNTAPHCKGVRSSQRPRVNDIKRFSSSSLTLWQNNQHCTLLTGVYG